MQDYAMEYNSAKEELILPEYGRNIQLLVQHAKTIENKEMRQAFAERLIKLMYQMTPQNRSLEEAKEKLWGDIFHIANYELGVIPDVGEIPTKEKAMKKPDAIPYQHNDTRYRHYGYNVQKLIEKAIAMEDDAKREGFVRAIASYMKLAYKTWNQEHYVSDEIIKRDLEKLSNGVLRVKDGTYLDGLANSNAPHLNNGNNKHKKSGKKHIKNSRGSKMKRKK